MVGRRVLSFIWDVHTLIPGTYEYATFRGKKDFADMIKSIDFEMKEIIVDYPFQPYLITCVLKSRESLLDELEK